MPFPALNWDLIFKLIELVIEFLRNRRGDRTSRGEFRMVRIMATMRTVSFRKWLKEEKGIELKD